MIIEGRLSSRIRSCGLSRLLVGVACLLAALARPARVLAVDVWTEPSPGVRHLHRSTAAPAEFHALVVDLTAPGVSVVCTPFEMRWRSTSSFARDQHLAAAINGGFWGLFGQGAQGLAAGGGRVWSSDDGELGFFAVMRNGRAMISPPADVVEGSRRGLTDGVSGRPLIVEHGRPSDELAAFPRTYTVEPRTAVGVSADGAKVILVTVDGRRTTSRGGTLMDIANLMIELGADRALNLDGGGSTTMFVASEGGIVNRPSRGWEREVVNHIGVRAPAPAARPAPPVNAAQPPVPAAPPPAGPVHEENGDDGADNTGFRGWARRHFGRFVAIDALGLGQRREIAVPLFLGTVVTLFVGLVAFVVRRVMRARRTG